MSGGETRERTSEVTRLHQARPRSRFVRISLAAFGLLLVAAWVLAGADLADVLSPESGAYLEAFLSQDVTPRPLRGKPWDWGAFFDWAGGVMRATGWQAAIATLAVSVLAIVLAAGLSMLLSLPAARTFATAEPLLPGGAPPSRLRRLFWRGVVGATRVLLVLMRSLPEYVLAFILLSILGHSAWPAVLALAIHNGGILGRLNAEVIENLPRRSLQAMRAAGASRLQIAANGVLPAALPRFLLYFFYRWETCVREATVLGMLGLAGLGYWINEAEAHEREDLLFLYVLVASALVLLGDFVSAVARGLVRRA